MLSEFELIDRFFLRRAQQLQTHGRAAHLGIGDDCALLRAPAGQDIAVSTDMLVSGRHFLPDVDAERLGHKSLAVNLSDLAAMGAAPAAFTLSLALPHADASWLEGFSNGLFALAERFDCELVGGDTTAGPLTISITVFGHIPRGLALRRDAAQHGDDIWLSGNLGDARLALGLFRNDWRQSTGSSADSRAKNRSGVGANDDDTDTDELIDLVPNAAATLKAVRSAMETPEPRVALGLLLRGVAHAAIDLSDGLIGDLAHILRRSGKTARVNVDAIPRSAWVAAQTSDIQRICTIAGGDDYELCFTAPVSARAQLQDISAQCRLPLTRVGTILNPSPGAASSPTSLPSSSAGHIAWVDSRDAPVSLSLTGFDHFE